jgi:26 proteasome complex subunit DSS1
MSTTEKITNVLEEDDEFEDFEADDWTEADQNASEVTMWEDDWDQDAIDDDFSQHLRSALSQALPTE